MKIMKTEKDQILFVMVHLTAFALMLFLTYIHPLYSDDIGNQFLYGSKNTVRVETMLDVMKSAELYYRGFGGRYLAQILIQALLLSDKIVYDIINATVYVLFAHTLFCFSGNEIRYKSLWLIGIYLLLWFFIPSFGGIVLWMTASITWLWADVPVFLFCLMLFRWYDRGEKMQKRRYRLLRDIGLVILAFLAGFSVEPAACTVGFILLVFAADRIRRKKRASVYEIVVVCSFVGGLVLLFAAPGNFVRSGTVEESSNLLIKYGYRLIRELYYSGRYMAIPAGLAVALLIFCRMKRKEKRHWLFDRAFRCIVYAAVSILVMTFSSGFSYRIFLTPLGFLIISIGIGLRELWRDEITYQASKGFVFFAILLLLSQTTTAVIRGYQTGDPLWRDVGYNMMNEVNQLF